MGTLLPFVRPYGVALVTSIPNSVTFPRFARESTRPPQPLRPILHTTEIGDDHPLR